MNADRRKGADAMTDQERAWTCLTLWMIANSLVAGAFLEANGLRIVLVALVVLSLVALVANLFVRWRAAP